MKLYRYIMSFDFDEGMTVGCVSFNVIRETDACFVVRHKNKDKFILKQQLGKRFAYTTKKQALESFGRRSKRRVEILEDQLRQTKDSLTVYNNHKEKLLVMDDYEWID